MNWNYLCCLCPLKHCIYAAYTHAYRRSSLHPRYSMKNSPPFKTACIAYYSIRLDVLCIIGSDLNQKRHYYKVYEANIDFNEDHFP